MNSDQLDSVIIIIIICDSTIYSIIVHAKKLSVPLRLAILLAK